MKYIISIIIEKPINELIKICEEKLYSKEYMPYFSNINYISGKPGAEGSIREIILGKRRRKLVLKETVVLNNLPHEKVVLVDSSGFISKVSTQFESVNENRTEMISKYSNNSSEDFTTDFIVDINAQSYKKAG
ncbi:MAG: hypothetical protein JXR53_11835 [Bacteroidales bacterium]|nr:hypothetical protein [Bacteroidales bacterium]